MPITAAQLHWAIEETTPLSPGEALARLGRSYFMNNYMVEHPERLDRMAVALDGITTFTPVLAGFIRNFILGMSQDYDLPHLKTVLASIAANHSDRDDGWEAEAEALTRVAAGDYGVIINHYHWMVRALRLNGGDKVTDVIRVDTVNALAAIRSWCHTLDMTILETATDTWATADHRYTALTVAQVALFMHTARKGIESGDYTAIPVVDPVTAETTLRGFPSDAADDIQSAIRMAVGFFNEIGFLFRKSPGLNNAEISAHHPALRIHERFIPAHLMRGLERMVADAAKVKGIDGPGLESQVKRDVLRRRTIAYFRDHLQDASEERFAPLMEEAIIPGTRPFSIKALVAHAHEIIPWNGANLSGLRDDDGVTLAFIDLSDCVANTGAFNGTNFHQANMNRAWFKDVRFSNCDFSDADLRNVTLTGVEFDNVNLAGAWGLETVTCHTVKINGVALQGHEARQMLLDLKSCHDVERAFNQAVPDMDKPGHDVAPTSVPQP